MADDWSDDELAAAVAAYREMQQHEVESKPYSKRAIYRGLAERFGRTDKSIEFRMQNISAVLEGMGKPWLPGLRPAVNVGANVGRRLGELLSADKESRKKHKRLAAYKLKLPALRDWLIEVARSRGWVTYGQTMKVFGIDRFSLRHAMDYLGHQAENHDEPIITALIVNKGTRHCSVGIAKEFGIHDDEAERERLYLYWAVNQNQLQSKIVSDDMEIRAAKFVSVEARPDQAAFRRAVFLAYGGKCIVSGCVVGDALDAAHKAGHSWRKGFNRAEDGYLMRKDIHALYDRGLLRITEDGIIELNREIADDVHYRQFNGARVLNGVRNALQLQDGAEKP